MIATMILALAAQSATATSPAPTPDYTQDSAWLCRPGRQDACSADQNVTVIRADGKRKIEKFRAATAPAFDCFYIYPTVSLDQTPNSDMTAGPEEQRVAASQAARFAANCRVFAPMYRQVTLGALHAVMAGQPSTADRAMPLADVTSAWNDYLARDNKGRGVVLIGHSQGANVLKALIKQQIDGHPAAMRNVIAAYLLGASVAVPPGKDVGGDFRTMPLCRSADQYGCVVTYMSFRAGSPPSPDSLFAKQAGPGFVSGCTNPAALGGTDTVVTDAILGASGAIQSSAPMGPWTSDGAPVTTPFVKVPGLISAGCASTNGFNYLAVTVNADPKDPRTDTIAGDLVINGQLVKDWGLHLIDMPVEMGNLVALSDRQAAAWRGLTRK